MDNTSTNAPAQGEAKLAKPLTGDELKAQLEAIEKEVDAAGMVTTRQAERLRELRQLVLQQRMHETTEVAAPA